MTMDAKPLADIRQAAAVLNLSTSFLYKFRGPGIYRIGRAIRIDLEEFLKGQR